MHKGLPSPHPLLHGIRARIRQGIASCLLVILVLGSLAACGDDEPDPTGTPATVPTAEVYDRIAPSVPFIETAVGAGSGVLIEGGYIVTNFHVVWPYESVWVVFPDGTELEDVPVVGWDPMADLAVLGPVAVAARPLALTDGEGASPGSELLLVGYPAEVDEFPQPTITRGILSRFREWERLGMTYFQTDAAIAGGQSGGALVNSKGEVVGISTFSFTEAGFGLAASSADIAPIVEQLIQGKFTSGLGDRRLPVGNGNYDFEIDLRNIWDARTFVFNESAGTTFTFGIIGEGDGWFHVSNPFGPILQVDEDFTGVELGEVELPTGGIHFVQVELATGDGSTFELASSTRLKLLNDPDDGRAIAIGSTIAGSLDTYFDWDWYTIALKEGETVRIFTDSLNVDTLIFVDFPHSRMNQVVIDDDSGGGLFGQNSDLVYRAPHSGVYFIVVTEATSEANGGYYLSVEPASEGTETVIVPPSPQMVDSSFGTMVVFEDPLDFFTVHVPESWIERESDASEGRIFAAIEERGYGSLLIIEEDVSALELGKLTLAEYTDIIVTQLLIPSGAENITREEVLTSQGFPAIELELSLSGQRVKRLIYLSDDDLAVCITYSFPSDRFDNWKDMVEYSFASFRVK